MQRPSVRAPMLLAALLLTLASVHARFRTLPAITAFPASPPPGTATIPSESWRQAFPNKI